MASSDTLRALSIFHTVKGIFLILIGCVGIPFIWVGLSVSSRMSGALNGASSGSAVSGSLATDGTLALVGVGLIVWNWGWGICNLMVSSYIGLRKKRTFIQVVSAINCLSVPLGTILGVFTIVAVSNEEVVREFAERDKRRRLRGY